MAERRYDDDEIREIFGRAADAPELDRTALSTGQGLTLAELQENIKSNLRTRGDAKAKRLLREARVAVSPGVGFGEAGEGFVRFALVENRHRVRQAVRGIRRFLREGAA